MHIVNNAYDLHDNTIFNNVQYDIFSNYYVLYFNLGRISIFTNDSLLNITKDGNNIAIYK